jgi:hypothetical protein
VLEGNSLRNTSESKFTTAGTATGCSTAKDAKEARNFPGEPSMADIAGFAGKEAAPEDVIDERRASGPHGPALLHQSLTTATKEKRE